jgi:outer membrane murein-binding lipoprotein Lpp
VRNVAVGANCAHHRLPDSGCFRGERSQSHRTARSAAGTQWPPQIDITACFPSRTTSAIDELFQRRAHDRHSTSRGATSPRSIGTSYDYGMNMLRIWVLAMAVLLASCSSAASVTEYAEELEEFVSTMNARLDQLDAELGATDDLEPAKAYAVERVEARADFLSSLRGLDPPDEIVELHLVAIGIIERLLAAESALADRVLAMDSTDGLESIWRTPEGVAARSADAEAIELCLAAQSEFDDTSDRAKLSNVPWIPPELKEVVVVAFGCIAADR